MKRGETNVGRETIPAGESEGFKGELGILEKYSEAYGVNGP